MSSCTQGQLVDALPGRPPLLSADEQVRRLALLDAIRRKAASPQILQEGEHSSRLLQLPRELLFAVLAWVPAIQTLADLRSTCSALFVVVEASGALHVALMTHLAAHTRALAAQHNSSSPPPLPIDTLVDSTTDAKTEARVKVAAQALRAAVEVGARRVPAEVLKELQQAFDPQLNRHKCFIAARVANDLPGALFVLSEGLWDEVVAMAFATELTWGPHHNEEVAMAPLQIKNKPPRDAWSGVSTLQLGPLKHITTAQELDDAFAKLPPTRTGEATHQLRRPDTSEVLQWFGQLNCAAAPFMVWQDTTFQSRRGPGKGERRFVLVGVRTICIVQTEYLSSACGGPYAGFRCGRG